MILRYINYSALRQFLSRVGWHGIWVILVVAAVLRLVKLDALPTGLNRDETSLGYTAYALQLAGIDEYGSRFPLNVKSFGDWKLGGYVYTLVPFVIGLGLDDWVVRLPSALMGIGLVGLTFGLVRQLLGKGNRSLIVGLLAATLLTFSPWHLHVSRVAYEGHLGLGFVVLGVVLFFAAHKRLWLYPLSAVLIVASMFTYHAFQVFTPLLGVMLLLFRQQTWLLWQRSKLIFILSAAVPVIGLAILLLSGTERANTVKFSGLSIFEEQSYASFLFERRQRFSGPFSLASYLYSNSFAEIAGQFQRNIYHILSPDFLFISGGGHPVHHVPGMGLLHWYELITILLGLVTFWKERKPWQILMIGWLVAAMIPASITLDPTHPLRFIPALIPLTIISAYGLVKLIILITRINNVYLKLTGLGLASIVVCFGFFYTVATYFFQFPATGKDIWPWYMPQVVAKTATVRDQYDMIIMQGESSSPYIYYLYHEKIDPRDLVTRLEYYPEDDEGFQHAKRLDNIYFQTVVWDNQEGHIDRVLYVLPPAAIPGDKLTRQEYKVIDRITDPNSKVELVLLDYDRFR